MRVLSRIVISWIFLISSLISLVMVYAADSIPLGTVRGLSIEIEEFVREFNHTAAAQQKSENNNKESLKEFLERQYPKRKALEVAERISKIPGGSTYAERLFSPVRSQLYFLSRELSARNAEDYSEIISALVADYYLYPEKRDALYFLLSSISSAVRPQISRHSIDPGLDAAIQGWGIALTALIIWDAKDGLAHWGGSTLRSLQEGMPMLMNRLAKKRPTEAKTEPEAMVLAGIDEASEGLKDWQAILGALGKRWSEMKNAFLNPSLRAEALNALRLRSVHMFRKELGRAAKATVYGGAPGLIYGINETPKIYKTDPLDVLRAYQALAILDLERQSKRLDEEAERFFSKAFLRRGGDQKKYKVIMNRLLNKRVGGFKAMLRDYQHFESYAAEFSGNIPSPDLTRRVAEYHKKFTLTKRWSSDPQERVTAFVASSNSLRQLALEIETSIRQDAKRAGLGEGDSLYLSLDLVGLHLASVQQRLQAIQELVIK